MIFSSQAQSDTTYIDSVPRHSPTKATLLSLALPGAGQAYNKKYWKIPIVYAAIGSAFYFAREQDKSFNEFKDAYVARVDDDPNTVDDKYQNVYSDENLLSLIDYHRENRDLLYVLTVVAYVLNVVDAAVDAHLYYFDVSDDLSANLRPNIQFEPMQNQLIPSLTLSLKFGKKPRQTYY
ncbi:MAG: hypothetical protein CMP59_01665 [Flavobacteriales bacterium]|nr:hypothetical protein [Flavobacteriales bacterium]